MINEKLLLNSSNKVKAFVYKNLIERLLYLTTTKRDVMYIMFIASLFSIFMNMHCSNQVHCHVTKRTLGYIRGITDQRMKMEIFKDK